MALLENRPDIDRGVDVRPRRRVSSDGRSIGPGEKLAENPEPGRPRAGIFRVGEQEEPPASVRLDGMTQMNRPGVGEADDRGGMKAHAYREALGKVLISRLG